MSMQLHCGMTPGSLYLVSPGLCSCSFSLCLYQTVSFFCTKPSLNVTAFLSPRSPFSESLSQKVVLETPDTQGQVDRYKNV